MSTILSGAPTEATVNFLKVLIAERFDHEIPADKMPQTQRDASGLIEELRKVPALPATDEQVEELLELAGKLGESYDPEKYADRAAANRIVFSLRRRLNAREFNASREKARELLSELGVTPAATASDDVPF